MTTPAPVISGASAASDGARDWQAVHADPSIQFAPVTVKLPPAEPPGWLKAVGEFLKALLEPFGRALGLSWPVLQWILLGLAGLAALYAIWRLAEPLLEARRQRGSEVASQAEWAPQREEALALLEDADRLAAEGRFDEAAHLLLQRSVQHISAARPEWVHRASTAREIAAIGGLSHNARGTFALIAGRVERSLFALRRLDVGDWSTAREAYAAFALERIGG